MPAIVLATPAAYEASDGLFVGVAPRGTRTVEIRAAGRLVRAAAIPRGRRRFTIGPVALPQRDVTVDVRAYAGGSARRLLARRLVSPVYGLPVTSYRTAPVRRIMQPMQRRVTDIPESGTTAVYVRDLRHGRAAAVNAGARYPAASTLKLAILATSLARSAEDPVRRGPWADYRKLVVRSSNRSANALLERIGGSRSVGSFLVNDLCLDLGCVDTDMFGGYLLKPGQAVGPPITAPSPPPIETYGKHTTAFDLSLVLGGIVEAAGGRGTLARQGLSRREARVSLWLLLHAQYPGLVRPFVRVPVAHKAGWLSLSQHDAAVVFAPGGPYVVVVMTQGQVSLESSQVVGREVARLVRNDRFWAE